MRISGKSIKFGDKKINKRSFYKDKKLFKIEDIEPHGKEKNSFKYFIGCNNDDDVIRSFCIELPQMIGYVKCFDSNRTMSFNATDNKLLRKYNKNGKKSAV